MQYMRSRPKGIITHTLYERARRDIEELFREGEGTGKVGSTKEFVCVELCRAKDNRCFYFRVSTVAGVRHFLDKEYDGTITWFYGEPGHQAGGDRYLRIGLLRSLTMRLKERS
ncbi:MAG: hypothetical protein WCO52_01970 [bacterium]